jgi:single-stranded-DNA-specific exonuclease
MGSPEDAFKLLSTNDMREAEKLAVHLEKINNERKGVVAAIVKDAKHHLAERSEISEVIVIGNPEWKPSLMGLVANSLVEEYSRPVFVWGRDGDGIIKGSCRGDGTVDLFSLMTLAKDAFIEFGGHSGAGGFSATLEGITKLESALSSVHKDAEKIVKDGDSGAIEIFTEDVNEKLWQIVTTFAPFGTGNTKPVFSMKGELKGVKTFGKENNHLEVVLAGEKKDVKAIAFFSTPESFGGVKTGSNVTLHATMEKSYFRNRPELRLRIVDISVNL